MELKYISLSPYISNKTLLLHYNKHYLKYLNNLKELTNDPPLYAINNIDKYNLDKRDDILYNAGGVLNHELYFNSMNNKNNEPFGKIKEAIDNQYGSFTNFKNKFKEKALKLVGSGYTFLVIKDNKLDIVNMINQETPYLYQMTPILALDLWEHAYYLDYYNDSSSYIDSFFQIIDFESLNNLYEQNLKI